MRHTLFQSQRHHFALSIALLFLQLLISCAPVSQGEFSSPNDTIKGVAAGDVTQTGVVLWAHVTEVGSLQFILQTDSERREFSVSVSDPTIPVSTTVDHLSPATNYTYEVQTASGEKKLGHFRTPADDGYHGLHFGVSGDWRGNLAPFVAVRNVAEQQLDFFVALGDTIYADLPSPALPQSQAKTLADFRIKHAEVYAPRFGLNPLADLRQSTAIFATIDDHEVTNDFAGGALAEADKRFEPTIGRINSSSLYENGLQAFQEFNPIQVEFYGEVGRDGRMDGARKLYRYRTFGSDAAIFLLDARSFRDLPVRRPDRHDPADIARFRKNTFRPGRTMLGSQQLADLKADLINAQQRNITWKFVLIPEPIQIRGLTSAQDRFEGYAVERADLLQFIEDNSIANVVFIAADIHGTLVNNLTFSLSPDAPQIATHAFEITTGPVAYFQTLGEVVIEDGINNGYVSQAEKEEYQSLSIAPDADNQPNDRDDFVKAILDKELLASGFDSLGLEGSLIDAHLLVGDYVALHSYGWNEFEIDATTQKLTITTWGIPPYTEADLKNRQVEILARQPQIVSQFEVNAQ